MADLGNLIIEVSGPRAPVVIFGGVFLIACGALGFVNPLAFAIAVPGILVVLLGARRTPVRIYERGVARGSTTIGYDDLRFIFTGQYFSGAIDQDVAKASPGAAKLLEKAEADITFGGPRRAIVRLSRSPQIDQVLAERILPTAVATWRKKLEAGETYKLPNTIVELKHSECWAPSPAGQPVLLPFRDTRIAGVYAYREGHPEPVAQHAALGHDLLLRALLQSCGVPVS
ncbi:MAG TPA: hypothetical protein VIV11_40475 [Kofleriaceae bacterium]